MDSSLFTLSKVFTERLFRIPDYQRGYAWTDRQLRDFWNDVYNLDPSKNHYTGVLTLEEVDESSFRKWSDDHWIINDKSYAPFYVVDGQQRLTTAIILIQVVVESLEADQELNHNTKQDIQRKFLFDSKDKGISRSYIFGYEEDNPSYEFLKARIFMERVTSGPLRETIYTKNLEAAKSFFTEKVAELDHDQVQILFKKITQNLLFNIFTISDDVDVCVAFETMNNRGKPLSYLELLKNRLIYLSYNLPDDGIEQLRLRSAINDCWKAIYFNLGRNKDNPLDDDKFLINHYVIYFGRSLVDGREGIEDYDKYRNLIRITRSGYSRELLEKTFVLRNLSDPYEGYERLSLEFLFKYVSSLQESVESWYRIFNPLDSCLSDDVKLWLDRINRLGSDPYSPLLLVFIQRVSDERKLLSFLQAVERHLFLLSLVYVYRHPTAFAGYPKNIKLAMDMWADPNVDQAADRVIKDINESISEMVKSEGYLKSISESFKGSGGFYSWDSIRYFLYEYESSLQIAAKCSTKKIKWDDFINESDDFITVEHIYPQKDSDPYWRSKFKGLRPRQKQLLRNSLGNLLPLSRPKNSSLSNRSFPEKVSGRVDSITCYKYGSYSEIEVSQVPDWTPQEILARGVKLLSFMEKRWQINFGGEKGKVSMLGLEFVHRNKA